MTVTIQIDEEMFGKADTLANNTLAIFKKQRGHYNNTKNSHLRGKLGEFACVSWLNSVGLECDAAFQDTGRMSEADIIISSNDKRQWRYDVKTWDITHWDKMGRCVAVNQLGKLKDKADGIIWCTTPASLSPDIEVNIIGWNTIHDIQNATQRWTGPANKRQVHNHQIDIGNIRPLADLCHRITTA